jgi:hypothetical protein
MVEITYQMVLSTLQTTGILVGIIYYITIMRNAQKTRELSLKAQEEAERARQRDMIFQKVQSLSLEYTRTFADVMSYTGWKDVEEFNEKYGWRSNPEAWSKLLLIERIYNSVGILLKENMVNADIVFELYPPNAILRMWEQFLPLWKEARSRFNNPEHLKSFEFLYNETKKRYPDVSPRLPQEPS